MATIEAEAVSEPWLVRQAEAVGIGGWPALAEIRDGDWLVRLSEGYTGRANSLNILAPADDERLERRFGRVLELFRSRGLPPLLRATPLTPPALLARLAAEGWTAYGVSTVLARDLAEADGLACAGLPARQPSSEWLDAMARSMEFSPAKRNAIARKLAHAKTETGYFLTREAGDAVATTMAAISEAGVGLFEVGVVPQRRQRGLGAAIVRQALGWASARGAEAAFLQVTSANLPAMTLYRSLGFRPIYTYRYLRPQA